MFDLGIKSISGGGKSISGGGNRFSIDVESDSTCSRYFFYFYRFFLNFLTFYSVSQLLVSDDISGKTENKGSKVKDKKQPSSDTCYLHSGNGRKCVPSIQGISGCSN